MLQLGPQGLSGSDGVIPHWLLDTVSLDSH